LAFVASLTLGLAPFTPEPHIVGKLSWMLGGGEGMAGADLFDVILHGAPWLWLFVALMLQLPFFAKKEIATIAGALKRGAVVVDVRSPAEFEAGTAAGAQSIPLAKLAAGIKKATKGNQELDVIVFCASGGRARHGASILRSEGYQRVHNLGGLSHARQVLAAAHRDS